MGGSGRQIKKTDGSSMLNILWAKERYFRIIMLVALALALGCVNAADARKKIIKASAMMMLEGVCTRLMAANMDITQDCDSKIINTEFSSIGATEFLFITKQGVIIAFHGEGGQAHSDADTAIQTLTAIGRTENGKRQNLPATGLCRFTNPYKGPATIQCEAQSGFGKFLGTFTSDGQKPHIVFQ